MVATPILPRLRNPVWAVVLGLSAFASQAGAQTERPGYRVVRQIRLGGGGRWDYITIDTAGNRLFIARQTRIMVVDQVTGRLLGEIPGIDGAHGVALDYTTGHGFASGGLSGTVTMFDLKTLKILGTHPAAYDADAISSSIRYRSMSSPSMGRHTPPASSILSPESRWGRFR